MIPYPLKCNAPSYPVLSFTVLYLNIQYLLLFAYHIIQSCTARWCVLHHCVLLQKNHFLFTVDGGHRAIIFSRIGGIQNNIYTEGLHFRYAIWYIVFSVTCSPSLVFPRCLLHTCNTKKKKWIHECGVRCEVQIGGIRGASS